MKSYESNKKIKILRIISRMNVGGPSKHVVNLSVGLRNLGYETLLISGKPSLSEGEMFELARNNKINLKTITCMERPISLFKDFKSFIQIIKEIKNFSPDIVHTHTAKAGIIGRLAALICGVPSIYHTYHGNVFKGYFSKFNSKLIIAIERFFSSFTTKLIALTPNLAKELKNILRPVNKQKITVIPLGLDLSKNLATPRKQNIWRKSVGFSNNDFVIGIVARLVPVKNHKLLINSMKYLCQEHHNLHLAIIGNGELENELKIQSHNIGLIDRIHFLGITKDVEQVYSDLDLLVLCSKNEGTPVVLIESLASGCPVASINVGGVEEVLNHGEIGRLLSAEPNEFARDLSKAISDIKNNNFKEKPNLQIRKKICDFYSIEKLVKNINYLYCNN